MLKGDARHFGFKPVCKLNRGKFRQSPSQSEVYPPRSKPLLHLSLMASTDLGCTSPYFSQISTHRKHAHARFVRNIGSGSPPRRLLELSSPQSPVCSVQRVRFSR